MNDKRLLRLLTGTDADDPRNRPLRPVDKFALGCFAFFIFAVLFVIHGALH